MRQFGTELDLDHMIDRELIHDMARGHSFIIFLRGLPNERREALVRVLFSELTSESAKVRTFALSSLCDVVNGVDDVALAWPAYDDATEEDQASRRNALRAMCEAAVPSLISVLLGDHDPEGRSFAAQLLGFVGPGAASAVPALVKSLTERVDQLDLSTLRSMDYKSRVTVKHAIVSVESDYDRMHQQVLETLTRLGTVAATAGSTLLKVLEELKPGPKPKFEHEVVEWDCRLRKRQQVFDALCAVGAAESVPTLLSILEDRFEDARMRTLAMRGLYIIGDDTARQAMPAIISFLEDALSHCRSNRSHFRFFRRRHSNGYHVQVPGESEALETMELIGMLGENGGLAAMALERVLDHENENVRWRAFQTIAVIGKNLATLVRGGLRLAQHLDRVDSVDLFDDRLKGREWLCRLRDFIRDDLDELEREIIERQYVRGQSVDEVAELLGFPATQIDDIRVKASAKLLSVIEVDLNYVLFGSPEH